MRALARVAVVAMLTSVLAVVAGATPALAATTTVPVHPGSPSGWGFLEEGPTGSGTFVEGPATAPAGGGSAQLTVNSTGRFVLGTLNHAGLRLSNVTSLEYSTYRSTFDAGNTLAASLQFDVDYDATDGNTAFQGRLVYEPYLAAPGGVLEDTWQTWDTLTGPASGYWWASGSPGNGTCPQANPCTWSEVLAAYPNAGIRVNIATNVYGALLLRAGGPWASGFTGNVDALTVGILGNDTVYDFEPSCTLVCYVNDATGNDMNSGSAPEYAKKTIQSALDSGAPNGSVFVYPGTYDETATNRFLFDASGPYQFGLFLAKDGVTVQGVDAGGTPITSSAAVQARVDTNATNNFGPSGIWVEGDGVSINGLEIGSNASGQNKTIEVIGDAFTLRDSVVDDAYGSIYLNDWRFDVGTDTSHVQSYTIDGNELATGVSIDIANGAGYSGPVSGRAITDNLIAGGSTDPSVFWPSISFNGSGTGVPWFVQSVGGAQITGNTFGASDQYVRARGTYDTSEFDFVGWFGANTFARAALDTDGVSARPYSYVSGPYTFNDVRRIGGTIQAAHAAGCAGADCNGELTNAVANDTVLLTGAFTESVNITIPVTLSGSGAATTSLTGAGTGAGITVGGGLTGVTVNDLTVTGWRDGIAMPTGPLTDVTLEDLVVDANTRHGIWSQAFGLTDFTVNRVQANGNDPENNDVGRGIWIINGTKTGVTITNGEFSDNALVGIDVSDGSVTDLLISGNTVVGNGDSGIAVLGAIGPDANLVTANTVTDNGRFGIELKNSAGNSAASGPGSLVVSNNSVSRSVTATDARDHAGIAVVRRFPAVGNPAQPSGAVVIGNSVSGYRRAPVSTGDGFGVVVEGTGNVVTDNSVSDNDVGVQVQGANPAVGQANTDFFDRGDAASGDADVNRNAITGNDVGLRVTGTATADGTCNWWGSASGPGGSGPGTGDSVSAGATFLPWLLTSNLAGACPGGPTVSIGDASVVEGDSGLYRILKFNVTLSQPSTSAITVQYATAPGSATAPADYGTKTGTLRFAAGAVARQVAIKVFADTAVEGDQTFTVTLSNANTAYIGRAVGTGTIVDDEGLPAQRVRIGSASVVEGNVKNRPGQVVLSLGAAATGAASFTVSISAGVGATSADFTPVATRTVNFTAGQRWKAIPVTLKPDVLPEGTETVLIAVTSVPIGFDGLGYVGTLTILDDD